MKIILQIKLPTSCAPALTPFLNELPSSQSNRFLPQMFKVVENLPENWIILCVCGTAPKGTPLLTGDIFL